LGTYFTFPELLLWIPLLFGILCFFFKKEGTSKLIAIAASLIVLCISITSLFYTLLTAIAFPLIFIATYNNTYKNSNAFYGLMLLTQAGLMGVFTAMDALLFYFFWELALIPVYFLCSLWGGERRIQTTFKFFVYTILGSLLMLVGIIYVYLHTPGRSFADGLQVAHSFALPSFYNAAIPIEDQYWLFWLFFAAFAVKMPVFPLHTWQPDTYDQSPSAVTMVLSGVMVKMGLFGVIRWMLPVLPAATDKFADMVVVLCLIGIIYASCIAIVQDNLRKLVAYSSIAHIGLMCAGIFALNEISVQGVMLQMFNHGINIIGLWIVVDKIEKKTGIKSISQLGGLATKAPVLTILLVIIAFANIALPLTNAFVGELMMFSGLYQLNGWYAAIAGVSIILAAVYMLNMVRKVFYGDTTVEAAHVTDISFNEKLILSIIVLLIFVFGVYPQPIIDLTSGAVNGLLTGIK
jgi:NADH-quinone oxidoreductase subunit M